MEKIMTYLTETLSQSERAAQRNAAKLCKYDDIKAEFEQWIETGKYPENGVRVEGYSAKRISELADFMSGVGVYNFLVTLRDNPAFGLESIKNGFPRRPVL